MLKMKIEKYLIKEVLIIQHISIILSFLYNHKEVTCSQKIKLQVSY